MNPVMCSSTRNHHYHHGWSSSPVQKQRGIPFQPPPGVSFPFSKSELFVVWHDTTSLFVLLLNIRRVKSRVL